MPLGLHNANLNFELLKDIGQEGRNSQVFLAHDKQLDGEIVVKQIPKAKLADPLQYYAESKILYASTHQHVVNVNYGCEDTDFIYIAMPYYKKGSLKKLIDSRFLSVREVLRYSLQFLSGLNHIHSKELIHFDVKPDNVLLSDADEAMLSDFGLAKAMNFEGYAEQEFAYPKQVPPEMFTDTEFTLQYDIYLAGLTLYRMLNGNDIFNKQFVAANKGDYRALVLSGKFPNRDFFLWHVPLPLRKIITKALSIRPQDRYNNVLEIMNELSTIDNNLDWKYSNATGVRQWSLDKGDKMIDIITIENDARTCSIECSKTMKQSGRVTKVSEFSAAIPAAECKAFIQKALRKLQ